MPGVPAIFLDHVADDPAQAGVAAVGPGDVDELVEAAVGQGCIEPGAGPFDGHVPQRVELFRSVAGGGGELPVPVAVPVGGVPRCAERPAGQLGAEAVVLDESEVLEQAAEGQRGGTDTGVQSGSLQVVCLPAEGRTQAVERTDEVLGLGAGEGRFPRVVTVSHGANVDLGTDILGNWCPSLDIRLISPRPGRASLRSRRHRQRCWWPSPRPCNASTRPRIYAPNFWLGTLGRCDAAKGWRELRRGGAVDQDQSPQLSPCSGGGHLDWACSGREREPDRRCLLPACRDQPYLLGRPDGGQCQRQPSRWRLRAPVHRDDGPFLFVKRGHSRKQRRDVCLSPDAEEQNVKGPDVAVVDWVG